MSNLNLPSCNLLLLTAHCFSMWHSLEFDTDICVTALQIAVGGYLITSAPPLHQSKAACIPHPSPKTCLRLLNILAANADGSEQHPRVTALGWSLVWPHRSSLQSSFTPGNFMSQVPSNSNGLHCLMNDILHGKGNSLHYFSIQSCFPWIFLGLGARRLSRPLPTFTPAYIFHCISSWLPLLI